MLAWENSGLSVDAVVRVEARDRAGFEPLLRSPLLPSFLGPSRTVRADWIFYPFRLVEDGPVGKAGGAWPIGGGPLW